MTALEERTIEDITGSTNWVGDWHRSLAALAYAEKRGIRREEALTIIIGKRLRWLDWLTATQRRWQRETRRPSHARHHDSIATREKYVRC